MTAEKDRLLPSGDGSKALGLTLRQMQETQPWTAPYSIDFARSKATEPHRSLLHDLMHVTKAVGILSSVAEWADHGQHHRQDRVPQSEYEGRIADLVMCALHMANNPPREYEAFDLYRAVVDRTDRVNKVSWECNCTRRTNGMVDQNSGDCPVHPLPGCPNPRCGETWIKAFHGDRCDSCGWTSERPLEH